MAKQYTTMNFFPFLLFGILLFCGWVLNLAGLASVQSFGYNNQNNPVNEVVAAYELQWSCLSWFRLFFCFVLMVALYIAQFRKNMSAYRHLLATYFAIDFVLIVVDGAIRIRVILHATLGVNNIDIMTLLGIPVYGVPPREQVYLAGLVIVGFCEVRMNER